MNLERVCAHESFSFWSTESLVLFTFVIKPRYVEPRYETYKILKLQNSFVTRREVLPGMVGKYYGEKKNKKKKLFED